MSTETIEGQSRASTGESKGAHAGSTIDCIMHLRPLQQALRGGQLASSTPDWLSGVGRSVRTWLQHWLKPRHLKGEDSRLPFLRHEVACRLGALQRAVGSGQTCAERVAAFTQPRRLESESSLSFVRSSLFALSPASFPTASAADKQMMTVWSETRTRVMLER